jgi:hypothetical protein
MSKYNDLIGLVRNWSNRDEEVLSDVVIASSLRYAADKAYRTLRVPPLEQTVHYTYSDLSNSTYETDSPSNSVTEATVPDNLIEFIAIRTVDSSGKTLRVINEKTDIRTFYDQYAEKYSGIGYWSRHGNTIVVSPGLSEGEEYLEIYYYGRLPALDTRYSVTAANANVSPLYISEVTVENPAPVNLSTGISAPTRDLKEVVYTRDSDSAVVNTVYYETTVGDGDIPAAPTGQTRTISTNTYYGEEVYNWLRDENERILLNGALGEIFIYLNEPESAKMFLEIFQTEIMELNREETKRKTSGGNVQINFNGNGLI